jgi:hypothetical protein
VATTEVLRATTEALVATTEALLLDPDVDLQPGTTYEVVSEGEALLHAASARWWPRKQQRRRQIWQLPLPVAARTPHACTPCLHARASGVDHDGVVGRLQDRTRNVSSTNSRIVLFFE